MSIVIGLDAGHGGSSTGTYSINSTKDGLFEKDYCLDLCKKVSERLNEHGIKTVLTRTTDINLGDVSKRAQKCIDANCNFCLSIHFNGFKDESANGCEVFVPYGEKGAGIEAGFQKYLGEFFKIRAPFARSNSYYDRNDVFDKKLNVLTRKFGAYGIQKDFFGFIRTCWDNKVSADLLEVCFLTNKKDFETYTSKTDEIADAIAKAICEGYKIEWKPEEAVEPHKPSGENGNYSIVFKDKDKAEAFAESVGAFVAEI